MSYYQELGWMAAVAQKTDEEICQSAQVGGRWLTTKVGGYCLGSDGKTVVGKDDLALFASGTAETIEVKGKAPAKKAFPWKPVLIGVAALGAIYLLTRKKGGAAVSSPAPVAP